MKIGVILLCRYSSSRLPGKIMYEIDGRPIISHIVSKILTVVSKEDLTVATSIDESDDIIEEYCSRNGLKCFRGSLTDVAKRFLDAAVKNNWDYAVRINGDNFFVETNVLRFLVDKAKTGEFDFLSNTHSKTFPQGMSVEIVRTDFFEDAYKHFKEPEDFEHVTLYLHKHNIGKYFFYDNTECPAAIGLKFAVDERKDFDLCESIYHSLNGKYLSSNMKEIVQRYYDVIKNG